MKTDLNPIDVNQCRQLFETWKHRDNLLNRVTAEMTRWMYDVGQRGWPKFGETANRLKRFRGDLRAHFDQEDELSSQMLAFYDAPHPEIDAMRRQADRDHRNLLERLDDLIERLSAIDPPFHSWQQAESEVSLLIDAIEQHGEQEAESLSALLPPASCDCLDGMALENTHAAL